MTAEFPPTVPVESEDPNFHLNTLRGQVDDLDAEILRLVEQRADLSYAIDREKERRGMSTIVSDRSTEVTGTYMKNVEEGSLLEDGDAVTLSVAVMRIMTEVRRRHAAAANEEPGARLQRLAEDAGETVI